MGSIGTAKSPKETSSNAEPYRGVLSRSKADEYTKDYTPEMFLGNNFKDNYMNLAGLKLSMEDNAPKELNIEGYTFKQLSGVHTDVDNKGKDIVMMDYQSTEQIGNEYPVLQVGIRTWRTRGGKVKSEIIRDGYTHKTRFWG